MAWAVAENPLPKKIQSVAGPVHPNPTLLFCRRIIEQAFSDATETIAGAPTLLALDSYLFLRRQSDYSRTPLAERLAKWGSTAVPEEVRRAHIGSYQWAARWLDLDPDLVLQRGLPPRRGQENIRGLPDVWRRWELARAGRIAPGRTRRGHHGGVIPCGACGGRTRAPRLRCLRCERDERRRAKQAAKAQSDIPQQDVAEASPSVYVALGSSHCSRQDGEGVRPSHSEMYGTVAAYRSYGKYCTLVQVSPLAFGHWRLLGF